MPAPERQSNRREKVCSPSALVGVEGTFQKGEVVAIRDAAGAEFARGLSNYSAADLAKIKGMKTEQIAAALGQCPHDEVIHRDNMAVTTAKGEGGRGKAET